MGGSERCQGGLSCIGINCLCGGDKVSPEPRRVIVTFVQRDPGDGPVAASGPLAQQRRLAETSRGGDERQLAGKAQAFLKAALPKPRVQPFDQAWAWHQLWSDRGDIEFGS